MSDIVREGSPGQPDSSSLISPLFHTLSAFSKRLLQVPLRHWSCFTQLHSAIASHVIKEQNN